MVRDDFYYEVRKKLDERHMQYKDLSKSLGITPAFISDILLRKCGMKSRIQYIPIIAKILGIEELPDDIKSLV